MHHRVVEPEWTYSLSEICVLLTQSETVSIYESYHTFRWFWSASLRYFKHFERSTISLQIWCPKLRVYTPFKAFETCIVSEPTTKLKDYIGTLGIKVL
jgi:hypothetical protein